MARVVIIRLDGIGDAAVLAPAIAALHDAGHEIGGVFLPGNSQLYRSDIVQPYILPALDAPIHALARILRDQAYDVALIATEKAMGYTLARQAGIPRRIGFWNGFSKPLKSAWLLSQLTQRYLRPLDDLDQHEVESLFRLSLGLHPEPAPTRDPMRLRALLLEDEPEREKIVLVQMTKKWQAMASLETIASALSGFAELLAARGIDIAIMGIQTEREYVQTIAGTACLHMRLYEDTHPWMNAIARASAIITPDTGAAHIAGMLGTPIIDLFPPLSSSAQRARWIPWAAPFAALHVEAYNDISSDRFYEAFNLLSRGTS